MAGRTMSISQLQIEMSSGRLRVVPGDTTSVIEIIRGDASSVVSGLLHNDNDADYKIRQLQQGNASSNGHKIFDQNPVPRKRGQS